MMRNMITFYDCARGAIERTATSSGDAGKITFNAIKARLGDVLYKLRWAGAQ